MTKMHGANNVKFNMTKMHGVNNVKFKVACSVYMYIFVTAMTVIVKIVVLGSNYVK
jgi:hypothetical protein